MLGLSEELGIFREAIVAGLFVMGSYDCIRTFRRIVKHKLYAIAAEDFFYWIAMAFYLFTEMYKTSDGSIRWYFIIGVCIGMIIFHWIFGRMGKLFIKIKKGIEKNRKTN